MRGDEVGDQVLFLACLARKPVEQCLEFVVAADARRIAVFKTRWYHSAMIDWSSCAAVERDPERVSGAWVFLGTRVPVTVLFENLEDGALVSQFVEWFPGVTLVQVRAVLEHAARSALARA
jgi:uncharacterized protein (DUF433 family)